MGMHSPIEQFEIHDIFPALFSVGQHQVSFTNASLGMVMAVFLTTAFFGLSIRRKAVVPGRWQILAEMFYNVIANTLTEAAGPKSAAFLPFILTIFMFILMCNLLGLVPFMYTVTAQLIVNLVLALTVLFTVMGSGFKRHGAHFAHVFLPSGVPGALAPFIAVLEFISFWIRSCSLALRLFANMLAGHILLKVFAGMAAMVATQGLVGFSGVFPVILDIIIVAFEVFVAFLQAYIFTILSSVYLRDAIEMH